MAWQLRLPDSTAQPEIGPGVGRSSVRPVRPVRLRGHRGPPGCPLAGRCWPAQRRRWAALWSLVFSSGSAAGGPRGIPVVTPTLYLKETEAQRWGVTLPPRPHGGLVAEPGPGTSLTPQGGSGLAGFPPAHPPVGPVLLHSFGIQHDGSGNDCEPVGKRPFIMSPQLLYDAAPLTWSRCSREYITRFLE